MNEKERYITEILGRLLKKHYPGGSAGTVENLQKMTENDITRAEKLASKPAYCEILREMLRRGVKMEQEMIS